MCWQHEDRYGNKCFDFVWNDFGVCSWTDSSIVKILENVDVKFTSHSHERECEKEFFQLLSRWHNLGWISPPEVPQK